MSQSGLEGEFESKKEREEENNNKNNTNSPQIIIYKRNIYHILLGIFLIFLALIIFITFSILILITKINHKFTDLNYSKNSIINFLITDKHYCLAIPILIPVTFIYFYSGWVSFNYFKYS
jgi:hypothetical protein